MVEGSVITDPCGIVCVIDTGVDVELLEDPKLLKKSGSPTTSWIIPHAPSTKIAIRPIIAMARSAESRNPVVSCMAAPYHVVDILSMKINYGTVFLMLEPRRPKTTRKGILKEVEAHSGALAIVFLLLFGLTFGFLVLVGATPDAPGVSKDSDLIVPAPAATPQSSSTPTPPQTSSNTQAPIAPTPPLSPSASGGKLPARVVIQKISLDVTVANPNSTNVDVLDKYLLKGAVRYPTSGTLGENGTVLLFGHSSYLPIVHNQAYKAFDGIQDLKNGDIINVYSGRTEYTFSVTGVRVADATNDIVELPQDSQHLTLVTCDSFASKTNRFVVTADLVAGGGSR